jgi:RNA polymerase sigma factor (sigma-70 family)
VTTPAMPLPDAELIVRTRTGDMAAYDELYRRHIDGAQRVARVVTGSNDEAQDVVSEAFTRVLDRLQHGGGPEGELGPYLNTIVRRLAIDRYRASRRDGLPADPTLFEVMPETDDPIARSTDRDLVRRAFETLPDRWQQVLWHTEIEGRTPAALAPTLGSTPNAVAALAYRAREGLRQAYLAVHLSANIPEECRPYVPKLAAYVRGTLSPREDQWVAAHVEDCPHCRDRREELMLLVADLRGVLWPALLLPVVLGGTKTAAALTGAAAAGVMGAKAGSAAGAGAGGAKAGAGAAGTETTKVGAVGAAAGVAGAAGAAAGAATVGGWFSRIPKPASLTGQIAAAAVAVGAVSAVVVATALMASDNDAPPAESSSVVAAEDSGQLGPPASLPRPSPQPTSTPSPAPADTVLPGVSRPAAPVVGPSVDPPPQGAGAEADSSAALAAPPLAPTTSVSAVPPAISGPSTPAQTPPGAPAETPAETPPEAPPVETPPEAPPAETPTDTPAPPPEPSPSPTVDPNPPPPGPPPTEPPPPGQPPTGPPPLGGPPWWWKWWCVLFPAWPGC